MSHDCRKERPGATAAPALLNERDADFHRKQTLRHALAARKLSQERVHFGHGAQQPDVTLLRVFKCVQDCTENKASANGTLGGVFTQFFDKRQDEPCPDHVRRCQLRMLGCLFESAFDRHRRSAHRRDDGKR